MSKLKPTLGGALGAPSVVFRLAKAVPQQLASRGGTGWTTEDAVDAFRDPVAEARADRSAFADFDRAWKKTVREQRAQDKEKRITKYLTLVPKR